MRRKGLIAAIVVLDALLLLHLAGGLVPALMFAAFVAFIVAPAVVLARRVAPMPIAALLVIVAFVPWFFARKAIGMPAVVDVATAAILTAAALRVYLSFRAKRGIPRHENAGGWKGWKGEETDAFQPSSLQILTFVVVPLLFSIVWLGWNAPVRSDVRWYGLFGIDFGNLVSVVSTLRASPMLPLAYVAGTGRLSYHWLYFTIPAALADAFGGTMPNANALLLANLLMAMLLVQTAASIVDDRRAALLVLFAPFTTYFYQAAAARLPLGPLALPVRNHLLLSPLNSMLTFGNNTVALVLALAALMQLERWNREGRLRDAVFGVVALAMVIGYSVTLVFPLAATLVIWTALGRVRRPLVALSLAAISGAAIIALFFALDVLARGSSRHIVVAFDRGQFLRMVVFGLLPLWGIAVLAARRGLTIYHVLIACCIAIPSMLYIAGSPTGATDFSMKTASLLAIAFARLIAFSSLSRGRLAAAVALIVLGLVQTSAYVLQFPYYRLRHATMNGIALPRDYAAALGWIRTHTPPAAIVVDPHELGNRDEIFTVALSERRVWLPTPYTNEILIAAPAVTLDRRPSTWRAFAEGHDQAAGVAMAREADVLVTSSPVSSPGWRPVHREGAWTVYRSTLHSTP
jgi:hypothetical protein